MTPLTDLADAPERDQGRSTFTEILEHLLDATPGAVAAVLVDHDGETVDSAGALEPFDLKVAAAHWQIVLAELRAIEPLGAMRALVVAARARSYVLRALHDVGYEPTIGLDYRSYYDERKRANPAWNGFALAPEQAFVLAIGPR